MNAKQMAADVLSAFKAHLDASLSPIKKKISGLEEAFIALPTPKDGINGKDGAPGKDGRDGIDGKDGVQGLQGERGEQGLPGKDGINGKDGSPGKDGRDGVDGNVGATGLQGERGKDGAPGKDGINGKDGADGIAGRDGEDGRDGRDGIDGRDAAQLDPLPAIDPLKSYPRGTWACHRGGLVRAVRTTTAFAEDDPLDFTRAGWTVMVEGQAECKALQEGERSFGFSLMNTSGKITKAMVSIPVVIDRGVFKQDEIYQKGDGTTFGGSFWIAQKDGVNSRPGEVEGDWRLAVKRGRDGKRA